MFGRRGHRGQCQEVHDHASDYLDGDATPSLAERIRLHLAECQDCNGFVATLRATVAALRNLPVKTPPESTVERVRRIAQGD
ncbi:MAG: zf-HC2 domain-containing protein [Chloroflexi bacterium]|nr:zf-HC2 domain-containing protein [Chloroflexota bacterium]